MTANDSAGAPEGGRGIINSFRSVLKSMEPEFSPPAAKDAQPTEMSSKPGKGRMVDVTDEGLAFQFLGAKTLSEESI